MLPVLLDLSFIKIYTQGIFFVLAFFWGSFFLWKNILLTSFKEEEVFDALFVSLMGGLFIGRLIHVILYFDKFGFDILKFILINGYPGLNFWGTILGAFITLYFYAISKKMKFMHLVDYVMTPLLLALGIGKIGAFFSGSEIGTMTKFPVAIKYANVDGMRHLTPFYEGILLLIGAFIVYKLLFEIRRDKHEEGINFIVGMGIIAFVTGVFDMLKIDRAMLMGYNFNIIVSGIILLTVAIYVIYYYRAAMKDKVASIKR